MVIIGQRSSKSTCGVNNDNILEIAMFFNSKRDVSSCRDGGIRF